METARVCALAHTVRNKLVCEVSHAEHDLRRIVMHANMLDSIMIYLTIAEHEEQQALYEEAGFGVQSRLDIEEPFLEAHGDHVYGSGWETETHEDADVDDDDDDDDYEDYEDEDMRSIFYGENSLAACEHNNTATINFAHFSALDNPLIHFSGGGAVDGERTTDGYLTIIEGMPQGSSSEYVFESESDSEDDLLVFPSNTFSPAKSNDWSQTGKRRFILQPSVSIVECAT